MVSTNTARIAKYRCNIIEEALDYGSTIVGMGTDTEDKSGESINETMEHNLPMNEG